MPEVMDELQSRFLVNLPTTELASSERLFFQIEQCYWFYEDFYADHIAHLHHLKLNDFAKQMFAHCPLLQPLAHQCENMFEDFKVYQSQVPVVGCILLNKQRTKLILVRNWKGTSWSFPRGKVNQGESDIECARREVMEECGYDVGDTLSEKLYIEFVQNQQRMRMYLAKNVPEDYHFAPQTRKEISLIQWFDFDSLPKKTWCVMPFMSRLRRWISRDKSSNKDKSGNNARSTTPGKGRAASAPKNRPMAVTANTLVVEKKTTRQERSMSTPHGRPVSRKGRGHFGTEFETATSYDGVNDQTFGTASTDFSVEEMFSVNERLTGQKFVYDGNPHDFGKVSSAASSSSAASRGIFKYSPYSKGVVPMQILPRPASAPMKRVDEEPTPTASTPSKTEATPFGLFKFDAVDIMACVT
uniref:Nudix hydrolase domain-containing protein n=1 Tax=Globisporangium ultimum (strain ATCC 200006 / CBS 805.95 / DAOM BR144) TaxID=431595 RepID=K3W6M7_GLOUD